MCNGFHIDADSDIQDGHRVVKGRLGFTGHKCTRFTLL